MSRSSTLLQASIATILCACATPQASTTPPTITQTEQTSGTTALLIAISPVNDNVAWAAGAAGTYVRTTNGGTTWTAAKVPGAERLQFRDVHAIDANNAFLLSIGNGADSRIYRTTDAGATWKLQHQNADSAAFLDCMDFWDPNRGIVIGDAVKGEVYVLTTSDGGNSWSRVPAASLPRAMDGEGSFAASGTCVTTRPGGHAWIVSNNDAHTRVLHTPDYGRTWAVDTLPFTTHSGTGAESVTFRDNRNGMIMGGGLTAVAADQLTAITRDGGATWSMRARMPLLRAVWGGVYVPGARVPTVVAVGPSGAAYTRDDAATWTTINTNDYWSVGFASLRAGWAVGPRGRITRLSGF